ALAPSTNAEILQGHDDLAGEILVDLQNVDFVRRDSRGRVDLACNLGHAGAGPELVGTARSIDPVALRHALGRAGDEHSRGGSIPSLFTGDHDKSTCAVGFLAAVVEPIGIADHP